MEIDPNSWYRLTGLVNPDQSLTSFYRGINTTGLLVLSSSNNSAPDQQWQLVSLEPSKYVLRTKASGPSEYLAHNNANETCEKSGFETRIDVNPNSSLLWTVRTEAGKSTIQISTIVRGSECYIGLDSTGGVLAASNASQFVLSKIGSIDDPTFSTIDTLKPIRTQSSPTTSSTGFTTSSHPYPSPTAIPTTPPSTPHTPSPSRLSPSTIRGISVAAAIVGCIFLVTTGLWTYRCWKVRHASTVQDYKRARLWKGFTPATPSIATTTFIDGKMANIYFVDLPTPATPAFTLSPRVDESWPMTPTTPTLARREASV
jgi:hypothetical protein